jgi:uncharacterized membrane protein
MNTTPAKDSSQHRFYILDFVRLVAMVLMMQGHTLDALVTPEQLNVAVFPWNLWHFLRGLTAPMFLMLSGAVQVFANKRDEEGFIGAARYWKQVRWSLMLVGIGYLLVFPANKLRDLPYVTPESWHFFFQVNILQLSGMTLLGVMTVMYFTRTTLAFARTSFAIGLALTLLSPLAYHVDWFALLPEVAANYFSPKHGSLFTLFPYSAYMFFGVSIGAWLYVTPASQREVQFPRVALLIGAILIAIGIAATYTPLSFYPPHDYYLSSPNFVALRVGCALLIMGCLAYVYPYTRSFEPYYSRLGKKSLYIYTAHLILLFGTPWFVGVARLQPRSLDLTTGAWAALTVIIATLGSAYFIDYYQRLSTEFRVGLRYSLTAALLYALLV